MSVDRGYFDLRMDFTDNIMGDVKVRTLDPYEVLPDPDAKSYDPSTWNEVITTRWMTLDDIEAHYGKNKRDDGRRARHVVHHVWRRFDPLRGYTHLRRRRLHDPDSTTTTTQTIRSVRIIERQYQAYCQSIRYFIDNEIGDMKPIPDELPDERAAAIAEARPVNYSQRGSNDSLGDHR